MKMKRLRNRSRSARRGTLGGLGGLGLRGALLFGGAAFAAVMGAEQSAHAQLQFGQIQGVLKGKETGKPLAGVTVVVSGPAMQGDQTEVSDTSGRYLITQLPPGDNYVVRFYFNDVVVEQPNIRIAQNKTLTIAPAIPMHKGSVEKVVIRERAPTVDTASANTGVEINQEILQNTATRGRTFESVMSLAPGSADVAPRSVAGGDVGVSFAGGTGNENSVIVDGLNTTDLNSGVVATQVHQYFIKEINVITGGYQAEYGRATGGVISIVTKNGSNEFHGAVFGSVAPFQAQGLTVARLGEALATRTHQALQYDYGFELGGPIIKDRIWFYVGFAPTFTTTRTDRVVRTQTRTNQVMGGLYVPETDASYQAPDYLSSPDMSTGLGQFAYRTTERPEYTRQLDSVERLYNWIGKLQFNINPDHNITLSYIGAPKFTHDYATVRNDIEGQEFDRSEQIHDGTLHYIGKLLDRKLQLDVIYGYHYQGRADTPLFTNRSAVSYRRPTSNPYSLSDFENVDACKPEVDAGGQFIPCPITSYVKNGYGQYTPQQILQRHALQASATYFLRAAGNHAIKLGFDFENNASDNTRKYSGQDFDPTNPYNARYAYQTDASGNQIRINRGYALPDPVNPFGDAGVACDQASRNFIAQNGRVPTGMNGEPMPSRYCYNYFRAITETRNYAIYLRDSWNISFVPGLVLNAGVRWEIQEVFGTDGSRQIFLWDNIAPRVGLAWDPTRKGRSKVYFNYGRFYQTVPMDINDRAFSGEGLLAGTAGSFTPGCQNGVWNQNGGRGVVVPPNAGQSGPCSLRDPRLASSGQYAPVAPLIKGQFVDEIVVGGQYDVGLDIVVGAYYTYRNLGNIIEDLSVNGGDTYFIANPGREPDPMQAKQLDDAATQAELMARANPNDAKLAEAASMARSRADVYKASKEFYKPKREYQAVTFTVNKRLSNRFSILANYTYSRLYGNFPGPFNPYTNQLDPNISSQFDIIDLLINRDGPLNNDRPHNVKITGFYVQPIGAKGSLTASLTFTALSGRPIQALGQNVAYGARQTFILPSGTAGRTPMVTQMDLHLGYEHQLSQVIRLSVFGDVVNLFNQQAVTNVDDEYTFSVVNPIKYGKPEDLKHLRAVDGSKIVVNSNYAQPTAFQAPLFLRLGARLSF